MTVKFIYEPKLESPSLVACWPGIGNIGLIAVDTLRRELEAEEFAEIEPWDFFYPKKIVVKDGIMEGLEFPISKFFLKRIEGRDLLIFIGEEQPTEGSKIYAAGPKGYQMANLVLDVAQRFGCQRVYTSGAAVSPVHHSATPRVWAVPNNMDMVDELMGYENTILMSDVQGRGGEGNISGLNGLLLGVARKRGLEALCLMGEIPMYLQGLPFPYPKASRAVLEVLTASLGIEIKAGALDMLVEQSEREIEALYGGFPSEIKEQLDKLKYVVHERPKDSRPITEEDKKKILEDIDKFFKKGPEEQ